MFGSGTSLGDEDLELETSFAPIVSSTQGLCSEKRGHKLFTDENTKKIKLDKSLVSVSPVIKKSRFENIMKDKYSPKTVVKRMFPGPAGLLPDHYSVGKKELICQNSFKDHEDFLFCSQNTVLTFDDGPWKMMTEDFSCSSTEQLYQTFTINWIKKKFCQKKVLDNYKVPFLAAIIQNLEIEDGTIPSIHVTFKDTTGSIDAVVLYSFYKEKSQYLTNGSVIVLKQIGVLSTHEGQCLTITPNNVLVIYNVRDPSDKEGGGDESKKEAVEKIVLQNFSVDEIWKEVNTINVFKNLHNKSQHPNIRKPMYNPNTVMCNNDDFVRRNTNTNNQSSSSGCSNFTLPKINKISINNSSSSCDSGITKNMNSLETNESKKKFLFKKVDGVKKETQVRDSENVEISCSQMSVKADKKYSEIWKTALEDVDTESLFGDF